MATDAQNLTGVWQGLYTYPNSESVSFVATLIDSGGALSGSTHEPCAATVAVGSASSVARLGPCILNALSISV